MSGSNGHAIERKIVLAMPAYDGRCTLGAAKGFWRCCRDMDRVWLAAESGSLLAGTFNQLWCHALNLIQIGHRVDYFAMQHADIAPEDFWLDKLIEEMDERQLDVLGVVVPIKDTRGMTSIALDNHPNTWRVKCRLSMEEIYRLPETFTSEDVGAPLLLNTGCWVCRFNPDWARKFHFEINDRIVFNRVTNQYQPDVESEDWFASRVFHEMGLKIGATRKVRLTHCGDVEFTNTNPWGSEQFDFALLKESLIPPAKPAEFTFPHDVDGWLLEEEGKALADLARGKRVLEIGSYCGKSTICLAQTAEHVTAIDPHDGRGTPSPKNTLEEMKANLDRYKLFGKVTIYSPDSWLAPDPEADREFDLAFIDGDHAYESVKADIEACCSYLKPGGLLAFHDYRPMPYTNGDAEVRRAVNELLSSGGELLSLTQTLAVVKPPAQIPCEV